jgi:hypothetical protein
MRHNLKTCRSFKGRLMEFFQAELGLLGCNLIQFLDLALALIIFTHPSTPLVVGPGARPALKVLRDDHDLTGRG